MSFVGICCFGCWKKKKKFYVYCNEIVFDYFLDGLVIEIIGRDYVNWIEFVFNINKKVFRDYVIIRRMLVKGDNEL